HTIDGVLRDRQEFARATSFAQRFFLSAQAGVDHTQKAQGGRKIGVIVDGFCDLIPSRNKRRPRGGSIALHASEYSLPVGMRNIDTIANCTVRRVIFKRAFGRKRVPFAEGVEWRVYVGPDAAIFGNQGVQRLDVRFEVGLPIKSNLCSGSAGQWV